MINSFRLSTILSTYGFTLDEISVDAAVFLHYSVAVIESEVPTEIRFHDGDVPQFCVGCPAQAASPSASATERGSCGRTWGKP